MTEEERVETEGVLRRIPSKSWKLFFKTEEGSDLEGRLIAVRKALALYGHKRVGAHPKPGAEVIELLGQNLLRDKKAGYWLREQILRTMPKGRWRELFDLYRNLKTGGVRPVHGLASQSGAGSRYLAMSWGQGTYWSQAFCEAAGLPGCLWQRRERLLPEDETVLPVSKPPPLHDFQQEVYGAILELINLGRGNAAVISLPTGAGKTRVAVEAVCDHLAVSADAGNSRLTVLWIAQSDELLRQAWDTFRQIWLSPPASRGDAASSARMDVPLNLVRAWGGRKLEDIELVDGPTVIVAGVQQLHAWTRAENDLQQKIPMRNVAAVVIDEAHRVLNEQHSDVLQALDLRDARKWQTLRNSPPVIGLTATPWRRDAGEARSLMNYFQQALCTPEQLGSNPIEVLQRRKILSRILDETLSLKDSPKMTRREIAHFAKFADIPAEFLERLGLSPARNAAIIRRISKIPAKSKTLIFACSVSHAELLTVSLNRLFGKGSAALVTSATPRSERLHAIDSFRKGHLRFLCNIGVLTTGFDAPSTDVVLITRPTTSAVMYEQMVGRGLRGPLNGGTERCTIIDVQDVGLPTGVLSYARVMAEWNRA